MTAKKEMMELQNPNICTGGWEDPKEMYRKSSNA